VFCFFIDYLTEVEGDLLELLLGHAEEHVRFSLGGTCGRRRRRRRPYREVAGGYNSSKEARSRRTCERGGAHVLN